MNGAFQMKYCMGPTQPFLVELGFEPGSPIWEAGAISIIPREHAQQ